jgi:hypothetical protein
MINIKTENMKTKKLFFALLLITIPGVFIQCKKDCTNSDRCNLTPDPGICLAAIQKYYYDKNEKKCKEFTWGGCGGVVPFDTKSECEKQCDCKS